LVLQGYKTGKRIIPIHLIVTILFNTHQLTVCLCYIFQILDNIFGFLRKLSLHVDPYESALLSAICPSKKKKKKTGTSSGGGGGGGGGGKSGGGGEARIGAVAGEGRMEGAAKDSSLEGARNGNNAKEDEQDETRNEEEENGSDDDEEVDEQFSSSPRKLLGPASSKDDVNALADAIAKIAIKATARAASAEVSFSIPTLLDPIKRFQLMLETKLLDILRSTIESTCLELISDSCGASSSGSADNADNSGGGNTSGTRYMPIIDFTNTKTGNRCYVHASIQCLLRIEPFVRWFRDFYPTLPLSLDSPADSSALTSARRSRSTPVVPASRQPIVKEFSALLIELAAKENRSPYNISKFKTKLAAVDKIFAKNKQECAEEFLSKLLDHLRDDTKANDDPIRTFFGYQKTIKYVCKRCNYETAREEAEHDAVRLYPTKLLGTSQASDVNSYERVDFLDLLKTAVGKLDDIQKDCECGAKASDCGDDEGNHTKHEYLARDAIPACLRFYIMLFDSDDTKLKISVTNFPDCLEFTSLCDSQEVADNVDILYDISAMMFHFGEDRHSGHWTCLVKDGNGWVYIDDYAPTRTERIIDYKNYRDCLHTLGTSPVYIFYSIRPHVSQV
jgi:Ubiquitin carboxyl-terminal hydrolase